MAYFNYTGQRYDRLPAFSVQQQIYITKDADVKIYDYTLELDSEDISDRVFYNDDNPTRVVFYYIVPANNKLSIITRKWTLKLSSSSTEETFDGNTLQDYNESAGTITGLNVYLNNAIPLSKVVTGAWYIPDTFTSNDNIIVRLTTNLRQDILYAYFDDYSSGLDIDTINRRDSYVDIILKRTGDTTFWHTLYIVTSYDEHIRVELTHENIQIPTIELGTYSITDIPGHSSTVDVHIEYDSTIVDDLYIETPNWITYNLSDNTLTLNIAENNDNTRSANIYITASSQYGYTSTTELAVTQNPYNVIPYIGDAYETEVDPYSESVNYIVRYDYKGNLLADTGKFTLYNYKNSDGDIIRWYTFKDSIGQAAPIFKLFPRTTDYNADILLDNKIDETFYYESDITTNVTLQILTINGGMLSYKFKVIQERSPKHIISQLWKDTTFSTTDTYFRIKEYETDSLIYNGIVYPNASNIITLNGIVESYIKMVTKPTLTPFLNSKSYDIIVESSNDVNFDYYNIIGIYHFIWDYSYNYRGNTNPMCGFTPGYYSVDGYNPEYDYSFFANPIKYYDPRQYVFVNFENTSLTDTKKKAYPLGYINDNAIIIDSSLDNITWSNDIYTWVVSGNYYDNIKLQVYIDQDNYIWECGYSKCTNADYAVYYINSSGIWCWMLFEGNKQIESRKTNPNKYISTALNTDQINKTANIYRNELDINYTLTSVYLDDEASAKLKDLYASPVIYLHKLTDNIGDPEVNPSGSIGLIPVNISTTNYDIKTFKNQGRKFFTHTITLNEATQKHISI